MEVVSIKVKKRMKERMRRLSHINWSEVIRQAIADKIQEEAKRRRLGAERLLMAARMTDRLRRPSPSWSSVEEIRKWRKLRK